MRKDDTQVDSNTIWIGEREGIAIIPSYLIGTAPTAVMSEETPQAPSPGVLLVWSASWD